MEYLFVLQQLPLTVHTAQILIQAHLQEELKREIALQRKKTQKEEARKEREKKEAIAQEHKIRGRLLAKFEEEARIEAEKLRISEKENKS